MKYAVNSEEMRRIDQYSIEVCKVPALELMERAAKEVVAVMKEQIDKKDRILAVCGPGNNGGDGVAAGRILYLQGYHVAILFIGEEDKASPAMKIQLEKARDIGVQFENRDKLCEYNIIIDALFGVGLTRNITGIYEEVIREMNQSKGTIYSVDIPSGISADDGKVMNIAVRADETITFGHQKLGLIFYPGADYAGKIKVADIGFPDKATRYVKPEAFFFEQEDLDLLPARKNYSNKGTYGKVLIIAGSKGMSGAAYLSAKAAYRCGAGLVKVLTSEANRIILQTSLPETLFSAYDEEGLDPDEKQEKLLTELSWASAIVIGPGIGLSETACELLETVIHKANVPVIIDADGITLLSRLLDRYIMTYHNQKLNTDNLGSDVQISTNHCLELSKENLQERLGYLSALLRENTILTPHLMELSRLIHVDVSEIANNLIDTAHQCSYNSKLIYAIKDARTIVAHQKNTYINVSGNNGMATGGSGDVLTGMIAALIAQGMDLEEAVCLAVYLHGRAGDAAAEEKGVYSLMASDIVNSIENVIPRKGKR